MTPDFQPSAPPSEKANLGNTSPGGTFDLSEIDTASIPSAALAALMDEVRNDDACVAQRASYNRTYNRHNR